MKAAQAHCHESDKDPLIELYMAEKRLRPCPFCAGDARMAYSRSADSIAPGYPDGQFFEGSCRDISCPGYQSALRRNSLDQAVERWNTRK